MALLTLSPIDCDRILVLDNGEISQYDAPRKLFANGGAFRDMCERSADWEELKKALVDAS